MTIVAAVKTRDTLVLGTDSVGSVYGTNPQGQVAFVKSYSFTPKLFQLRNYTIGVATWGLGNLGARSIGGLVAEFGDSLPGTAPSLQDTANRLRAFFEPIYNALYAQVPDNQKQELGFLLGGYSQGQRLSELWEVRLPTIANATLVRGQNDFGANWRGIAVPFTRLHMGFDPRIADRMAAQQIPQATINAVLNGLESPVVFDSMPTQSALDFCRHILTTTIRVATFETGVATVGEPLQIAFMSPQTFTWAEELKSK